MSARKPPPRRCPHGGHITETDAQVCGLHRERDALRARAEAAEKALRQALHDEEEGVTVGQRKRKLARLAVLLGVPP